MAIIDIMCVFCVYPTIGLLKERNAEVGQLMGEKAALERELEKLKEQVSLDGYIRALSVL